MFNDRWKTPRAEAAPSQVGAQAPSRGAQAAPSMGQVTKRNSNALQQFFENIRGEQGLNLLDFSGASQANIGFITNLGHRLYSEDLLRTLELAFGGEGDFYENQCNPERQAAFLENNLNFPDDHFDGALIWDSLEFLAPPLLKHAADLLTRVIKRRGYVLAMFHAEERSDMVATYSYRISDPGTLLLAPRGMRRPAQLFNNRAVEKLFQGFESVKFFLSRDALREVIVKR